MRTRLFSAAAIALLAVACTKEQPVIENVSSDGLKVTASVEQPGGDTKTSLDGLNVKWTVGDKIKLTNGTQTAIYQATTAATTTTFTKVSGDALPDGDVYAYYPADNATAFSAGTFTATIPAVQAYTAEGFADGVNPMTAKGTISGGTVALSFKNVMAFVKLQISDSGSGKALSSLSLTSTTANLSGTASVAVGAGGVATAAITTGSKTVELAGIGASLTSSATPVYVAVPAYALGTLTITAKTTESTGLWSQTKGASNSLTPERSNIYSYNAIDITTGFSGRVKVPELAANCYMVDATSQTVIAIPLSQATTGWTTIETIESTSYATVKNSITEVSSPEVRTIAVRWLDGASGTISLTDIDATTITLSLTCTNGSNAVVDLKNGSGIVVWSWHLWFTDYKPAATQAATLNGQVHTYNTAAGSAFASDGLYYGKVMMDRNLGATTTGISGAIAQPDTDDEALNLWGLYYQFGRNVPFATTGTVSTESGAQSFSYATKNPDKFITGWVATGTADPWNAEINSKSIFDPCPNGWRIPNNGTTASKNVWTGIPTTTWQGSSSNYRKGNQYNNAWIPAAGCRNPGGSITYGTFGLYWAASARSSASGEYGRFADGEVSPICSVDGSKAYGLSIRCVKE